MILGAKETILFGGKGNVTSLPTSSINFKKEAWDIEAKKKISIKRIKKNFFPPLLNPLPPGEGSFWGLSSLIAILRSGIFIEVGI